MMDEGGAADIELDRPGAHLAMVNASFHLYRKGAVGGLVVDKEVDPTVVGDRQDVNPAHGFAFDENPAYTKVDLATSYTFEDLLPHSAELTVFAKIENLLDEHYDEALGFRAPPINFLAGVRAAF